MLINPFRSGFVQLVRCPVESETVIKPGDLVFLENGNARPAESFPWTTDLATTRANFAAQFLGIAYSESADGETDAVSVDIGPHSIYELASMPATVQIGDLLAPAETLNALSSRTMELVSSASEAVARAVEATPSGSSSIRCCIASAYNAGSANINAAVG